MALEIEDIWRERRFLRTHPEWNIFSVERGARWHAEREADGTITLVVRLSLPALLDRLEEVAG